MTQNTAEICKNWIETWGLKKTPFFAEKCDNNSNPPRAVFLTGFAPTEKSSSASALTEPGATIA
jgi:hypothetical protein